MGIQGFTKWIKDRYNIVSPIEKKNFDKIRVDNFYIEMNEIIHENLVTNVEAEIFSAICDYVNELVLMVKPKKLIFIAVDGVAPRAKMNEQRKRRFIKTSSGEFDSNSVTPGTSFMENLSTHFKEFIHNKIKNDKVWKSVKIIYSGHDVPGEGEHKILKHIRNSESKSESDCIYGRDSDLILLGLMHYKPNLKILSSNEFSLSGNNLNSRIFEIKFLGTLRRKLNEEFSKLWNPKPFFEFNIESIIKDFILLVLFMGNDFIPTLSNINKGLDEIISIYKKILKECGGYIYDAGNLNKKRLEIIFKKLGVLEREPFKNSKQKFIEVESDNEEFLRWKKKYYRNNMMIKEEQDQKHLIKPYIESYIEGLQWILSYYEGSLKSYRWFYPGYYSPLISDLEDLETIEIKNFKDEDYYKPLEQLMFVLPIKSKKLLPVAYQNLMSDPRIEEFYPTNVNVIDNLPFINEKILLSVLESAKNNLTNEEKQRNEFGNVLLFEYDELSKKVGMQILVP
ncbi:5-3 exoribonuclease 1 [Gigaspora margarita]|uniref:5-3 exoribonuclease 1 n=1 Tax=Gigaspora margarita TaxID=4874 RepID=A0A8H4B442_GIGMA|nr:5-3 exoribonuclease 1 [Gigaspora margarita]